MLEMFHKVALRCAQCAGGSNQFSRQIHTSKFGKINSVRSLQVFFKSDLNGGALSKQFSPSIGQPRRNYSAHFTYVPDTVSPNEGETARMNLFQAVNNAMDIALASDPTTSKHDMKHWQLIIIICASLTISKLK